MLSWLAEVKIRFTVTALTVLESAGTVNITVEKEGAHVNNFTIFLTTADGTAQGVPIVIIAVVIITAILHTSNPYMLSLLRVSSPANEDYSSHSTQLTFSTESSQMVSISIINDDIHEKMEQFTVQLSLPSGSTGVVLDQNSTIVQIVDEDSGHLIAKC